MFDSFLLSVLVVLESLKSSRSKYMGLHIKSNPTHKVVKDLFLLLCIEGSTFFSDERLWKLSRVDSPALIQASAHINHMIPSLDGLPSSFGPFPFGDRPLLYVKADIPQNSKFFIEVRDSI
jgi:hypothetical protein